MMNIEAACKSVSCGKTFAAVSFFFYSAMVNYVELCYNISCTGRNKDIFTSEYQSGTNAAIYEKTA